VYRPLGGDNGPLLVIQMYASVEAYQKHNSWVRGQIPRISELLATPPAPPALFEPVPLGDDAAMDEEYQALNRRYRLERASVRVPSPFRVGLTRLGARLGCARQR
jgi:hypothetical protein